ncbi:MAG: SDR family oxidoreductase [Patescibacteria group bacterium]
MLDLQKKTILIAGSSGDIGLACADLCYKAGAHLILHSNKNSRRLKTFQARHKAVVINTIQCDATSEPQVKLQFQKLKRLGIKRIDVLVFAIGDLVARKSFKNLSWNFVQHVLNINLKSAFLFTQQVLPFMRRSGSIIFISSLTARSGKGDRSTPYSMAKGAIISLSRSLAYELGPSGIRVNTLTPGFIQGKFHKRYTSNKVHNEHRLRNPLGRLGSPEDVAAAVLFYATQKNGYISGTTLDVCGGDYMA